LREEFAGDESDIVQELVAMYLESTPEVLDHLRAAVAKADAEGVRRAAHELKGSSANLGAQVLAALCGTLEKHGRMATLDDAPALFAQVEQEYARVGQAFAAAGYGG
jgi:HPt (histidine-containing phosphotransfer) domain-containing protein